MNNKNVSIKEVAKLISTSLAVLGFKKRGNSWYRSNDEVVQVVNLQKSQWGEQYYENLGVLIRILDDTLMPRPARCHLVARLSMLVQNNSGEDYVIDLEKPEPFNNIQRVLGALENSKRIFLEKCSTLKGILKFLKSNSTVIVSADARLFIKESKL